MTLRYETPPLQLEETSDLHHRRLTNNRHMKDRSHGAGDKNTVHHKRHTIVHHKQSESMLTLAVDKKPVNYRRLRRQLSKYPAVEDLSSFNELEIVEQMIEDMHRKENQRKTHHQPPMVKSWFTQNPKTRRSRMKTGSTRKEILEPMKVEQKSRKSIFGYTSSSLVITKNGTIKTNGIRDEVLNFKKPTSCEKYNTRPRRKPKKTRIDEKNDVLPPAIEIGERKGKKKKLKEHLEAPQNPKVKDLRRIHRTKPWRNIFKQNTLSVPKEPQYPTILWQTENSKENDPLPEITHREAAGSSHLDTFTMEIHPENRKRPYPEPRKIPRKRPKLEYNSIGKYHFRHPKQFTRETKKHIRSIVQETVVYFKNVNQQKDKPKKSLIPVLSSTLAKTYPRLQNDIKSLKSESDVSWWKSPSSTPRERKSFLPLRFGSKRKTVSGSNDLMNAYAYRPSIYSDSGQFGDVFVHKRKQKDKSCEVEIPIESKSTQVSKQDCTLAITENTSLQELWKSRSKRSSSNLCLRNISSAPSLITEETQTTSSSCILRAIKSLVRRSMSRTKKCLLDPETDASKTISKLKDTSVGKLLTTCSCVQTDELLNVITTSITSNDTEIPSKSTNIPEGYIDPQTKKSHISVTSLRSSVIPSQKVTNFASYFGPDEIDTVAAQLDSKNSNELIQNFLMSSKSSLQTEVNRNELESINDAVKRLEARINQRKSGNPTETNHEPPTIKETPKSAGKQKKERKGILRLLIGRKRATDDDRGKNDPLKVKFAIPNPKEDTDSSVVYPKQESFDLLLDTFKKINEGCISIPLRHPVSKTEREQLAEATEIRHCFKRNFEPGYSEDDFISVDSEPFEFLTSLGISGNEATVVLKDECIKANLTTALFECRIMKKHLTRLQGILLYLLSLKACNNTMVYYLQLVDAVIHCKIAEPIHLDRFLQFLDEHCKNVITSN